MAGEQGVEAFFAAYAAMVDQKWPTQSQPLDGFDFRAMYGLRPPVLSAGDVSGFESRVGPLPEDYKCFLLRFSFKALDLEPWIRFPSNDVSGLRQLRQVRQASDRDVVPFAFEWSRGAPFVFDCRAASRADPPIGLSLHDYEVAPGRFESHVTLSPLATSFSHLLAALTCVLKSATLLWVRRPGEMPTAEQLALVREVRATDPAGLGGIGWKLWWGRNAVNFPTEGCE
jgi:hypothetical protein